MIHHTSNIKHLITSSIIHQTSSIKKALFHHPSYIEEFFHQPSAIIKDPCS